MKKTLEKAAKKGRFGDDRLLHVSQIELDGLASLVPGGRLPVNPDTGLPEAFFFLPFLAGLGAAAAPAAAATGAALTGAAAAAAPAAAAGLAAGAGAAGAAGAGLAAAAPAAAGLTAAAAPTAATAGGLASLGAAAPTAASAIPAAASTVPGAAGGMFGSTLAATTIPANAAPAAAGGLGSLAPAAAAPGASGSLFGSTMATGKGVASALPATTSAASAPAAAAPAALPSGQTAASAAGTSAAGGFPAAPPVPAGSAVTGGLGFPAAPAAPKTGIAGLAEKVGLGNMDMGKMLQYGALASMMMPQGGGGGGDDDDEEGDKKGKKYDRGEQVAPPDGGRSGGITKEWNYFPNARYYAEGGLASLGGADGGMGDEDLIDATVAAIQGQTPNANAILEMFVQRFGPDALRDLAARVQGQQANSDGLSDSVPAQINSNGMTAPAQLSEGEYVVPSDVVSGLGNGSTEAGARQLEDMVSRTREMRGMPSKPKAIDPMSALPA